MENNKLFQKAFLVGSLVILALPLLNLPPWFSPPDWGKTMAFRMIFSVLFFLFIWNIKHISLPSLKKKESLALVLLLLLTGIFLLSTLFSFDRNFSMWGNPARGGGFVNFASLILFSLFAFLMFRPKDWQKAWDVAIFIGGVLVAMVAVFQWQGWFSHILISKATRPMSTLGNDIQLAMYLVLLLFPAFAFLLQEKKIVKKILYLFSVFLFLFVIILTGSRGSYLGIGLGFSYFILLYPLKKLWHSLALKLAFFGVILIPFLLIYYVNTQEIPKFAQKNVTALSILSRLQLDQFIRQEPRFSTWKVGWEAIKARPILGYGPENFEIGFDKYYDPQIPNLQYISGTSNTWWDRAHNFFVDNASQAGIFAGLIYAGIFLVLIFQLQKFKNERPDLRLTAHGLQATFIAYLAAVFWGFDTFSTYLISFLAVAYALFLMRPKETDQNQNQNFIPQKWIKPAAVCAAILLLWFNWEFTLKPFTANTQIVIGQNFAKNSRCDRALIHLEKALGQDTVLNAYVRASYFDALRNCEGKTLQDKLAIVQKEYTLMKEASNQWPYHTRNWIFLGQVINLRVELTAKFIDQQTQKNQLTLEQKQQLAEEEKKLIEEAHASFKKAQEISPKHQEIYLAWTKTFFLEGKYALAKTKAEECIALDPRTGQCFFLKAVAEEFLKEHLSAIQDIRISKSKKFNPDADVGSLTLLLEAYIHSQDTGEIIRTYQKLIALRPNDSQLHASLAVAYATVNEFSKAREEAKKVLELNPDAKAEVQEFLKLLQ